MTETLIVTAGVITQEDPPGSVGKIVNNVQIKVLALDFGLEVLD